MKHHPIPKCCSENLAEGRGSRSVISVQLVFNVSGGFIKWGKVVKLGRGKTNDATNALVPFCCFIMQKHSGSSVNPILKSVQVIVQNPIKTIKIDK